MFKVKTRDELKKLVNKLIKERGNNCDLNDIDVSEVTYMGQVFEGSSFNGDISKWDTSNVESMFEMFRSSSFNGDISNWNVSKVTNMGAMFYKAEFHGDISNWNVSNVEDVTNMFVGSKFKYKDISNWKLGTARFYNTEGKMFESSDYRESNLTESSKLTFREYLRRHPN